MPVLVPFEDSCGRGRYTRIPGASAAAAAAAAAAAGVIRLPARSKQNQQRKAASYNTVSIRDIVNITGYA